MEQIVFRARVVSVVEKKRKVWARGTGEDAIFAEHSMGWFINLEGSFESIYVGSDMPQARPGDMATVTMKFEKGK